MWLSGCESKQLFFLAGLDPKAIKEPGGHRHDPQSGNRPTVAMVEGILDAAANGGLVTFLLLYAGAGRGCIGRICEKGKQE